MGEVRQEELTKNTQQLLDGPLKHVRAAALAAALVPLASLVATPASAQTTCGSGGTVCGFVFNDTNQNGIQDAGETGIAGVAVTITDGTSILGTTETGPDGIYYFFVPAGTYTIFATTPQGYTTSPPNVGSDDTIDSDGVPDGSGNSVAANVVVNPDHTDTDFGFFVNQTVSNPGTGTLGYWKNHPEAWPSPTIIIAGQTYTVDQAIYWMQRIGKDRTTQMFAQLVAAKLNVSIGNDPSCIASTISAADSWLTTYPIGSNVAGGSAAWVAGDPIASQLDAYNNGQMCAPHRK
jgi:hypothetical protein